MNAVAPEHDRTRGGARNSPAASRLGQLAREPLVHFLTIGVLVFAVFSTLNDTPPRPAADQIVVTPEIAARLASSFEATWRRPPTRDELAGLIEDHVREEIYVREALALGLDREDTVIRRRLRQKMEFLTASAAESLDPSEQELRAHLEAHPDRFTPPPQVAFEQVFLGEDPDSGQVQATLSALRRGTDPTAVGARTLLPAHLPLSAPAAVDGTFGQGFFETIAATPPGAWQGPVASGYGQHLVRLNRALPAEPPPFEMVRDEVLQDWKRAKAEELSEQQFEQLKARYAITRPDPSAIEAVRP